MFLLKNLFNKRIEYDVQFGVRKKSTSRETTFKENENE